MIRVFYTSTFVCISGRRFGGRLAEFLQLLIDSAAKSLKAPIFQAPAVDKDGGRSPHSGLAAVPQVLVDDVLQGRIFAVIFKLNHVELKPGRDLLDFLLV